MCKIVILEVGEMSEMIAATGIECLSTPHCAGLETILNTTVLEPCMVSKVVLRVFLVYIDPWMACVLRLSLVTSVATKDFRVEVIYIHGKNLNCAIYHKFTPCTSTCTGVDIDLILVLCFKIFHQQKLNQPTKKNTNRTKRLTTIFNQRNFPRSF